MPCRRVGDSRVQKEMNRKGRVREHPVGASWLARETCRRTTGPQSPRKCDSGDWERTTHAKIRHQPILRRFPSPGRGGRLGAKRQIQAHRAPAVSEKSWKWRIERSWNSFACRDSIGASQPKARVNEGWRFSRTAIGHNPHRSNVSGVVERGWSERGAMVCMEPHMTGKGRSSLVDTRFPFVQSNVA